MNFIEFRLKFRRWFRKYRNIILLLFLIWFSIFLINYFLKHKPVENEPITTYEAHQSVIDSTSTVPKSLQNTIEEMLKEYIGYCNEGNYQKAFNMLSEDCRKYEYNDNVEKFMNHVLVKMPVPKHYAIQDYSNTMYDGKDIYVYEIKYTDDLLATGLTNSTYAFTSEKIAFYREDGDILMNVGEYIYHTDVKSISENEYFKIDVIDKTVNYDSEVYEVKLTNRSDYTVVVADGIETEEVVLVLPSETRNRTSISDIVLEPRQSQTLKFKFTKYVDDGDKSQSLLFSSIRVMEKYSGVDEIPTSTIQSEIDNAISKFSMTVSLK